jgi:hypothetical protein
MPNKQQTLYSSELKEIAIDLGTKKNTVHMSEPQRLAIKTPNNEHIYDEVKRLNMLKFNIFYLFI